MLSRRSSVAKAKTYFEQIPVEAVKKIVEKPPAKPGATVPEDKAGTVAKSRPEASDWRARI